MFSSSFASGVISISGKVHSFDKKYIAIQDDHNIYYIKRNKLNHTGTLTPHQKINKTVSFESIFKVKSLK